MERLVYRVNLDAMRTGVQTTLQGCSVGEKFARAIKINLSAKGEAIYLGRDATAVMYITKKGAITPSINDACLIEDNTIIYELRDEDIDTAGMVKMQVKVITTDKVLIAPVFQLEVMPSNIDDSAVPSDTYTELEQALSRAKEVYDKRLINVEFVDYVFYAHYADDTTYENDDFKSLLEVVVNVDENEAARQEAEEARIASEVERINAELIRIANEEDRVNAENGRVDAEDIRVASETTRDTNEAQRIIDEQDRIHEESIRVANEAVREANEQTRIDNEQNREDTFGVEIERIEDAVVKSNEAVKVANKALDDVQGIIAGQGVVTQTERDNWNEAYDYRHTHPNKAFLDSLTRTQLDAKAESSYVDSEIGRVASESLTEIGKVEQYAISEVNRIDGDIEALASDVTDEFNKYLKKPISGEAQGLVLMSNGDGTNFWGKVDTKVVVGTIHLYADYVSDNVIGKVVTAASGSDVVMGTFDEFGKVTLNTAFAGTYTITVDDMPLVSKTIIVEAFHEYDVELHIPHSIITVVAKSADLFGKTVTLSDGQTANFGENGESVEFTVYVGGNYTASVDNGTEIFTKDFVVVIDEDIEIGLSSIVTLSLLIEGANQDTINITNIDGELVGTCIIASGTNDVIELSIPTSDLDDESRPYIFTSSVSKAVDGSGENFSKYVNLKSNTTKVLVMPSWSETDNSNLMNWYGNEITSLTPSNQSNDSSYTGVYPTVVKNTNSIKYSIPAQRYTEGWVIEGVSRNLQNYKGIFFFGNAPKADPSQTTYKNAVRMYIMATVKSNPTVWLPSNHETSFGDFMQPFVSTASGVQFMTELCTFNGASQNFTVNALGYYRPRELDADKTQFVTLTLNGAASDRFYVFSKYGEFVDYITFTTDATSKQITLDIRKGGEELNFVSFVSKADNKKYHEWVTITADTSSITVKP